jgi:hypothetical protein
MPLSQVRLFVRLSEKFSKLPVKNRPDVYISRSRIKIWDSAQKKASRQALREEERYQATRKKKGRKTADVLKEWGIFKDFARWPGRKF